MPLGPGKYDAECTEIRERLNADGIVLIVFAADGKCGFSAQLTMEMNRSIPTVLRIMADAIERGDELNH